MAVWSPDQAPCLGVVPPITETEPAPSGSEGMRVFPFPAPAYAREGGKPPGLLGAGCADSSGSLRQAISRGVVLSSSPFPD